MLIQIALGSALLITSILIAGVSFWLLECGLRRMRGWLTRAPHRPKLILVLCLAALWILAQMTAAVWLWALTMLALGIFDTLELSVYFALVAFTTLGFGDVLLPMEWRLLSGMAAVNGLLNIGLVTAGMVEMLRQLRLQQITVVEDNT
ncbi:ion channel [Yoonia sediminilitoris]|uniref:Ion channel n=1 Tax=Yoonia sediminilitoris TaxID=1286148 RepID=A0A2T6KMV4_9RHOB|nr:ion channel [Yoonia sediminilitoris]PUB17511.1 ion channel [Yoonia sediminilitoris]RCW97806.1 ion channel [Yoonia sediminilitoris]